MRLPGDLLHSCELQNVWDQTPRTDAKIDAGAAALVASDRNIWSDYACIKLGQPLCVRELARWRIEVRQPQKGQFPIPGGPGNGVRQLLIVTVSGITAKDQNIDSLQVERTPS